MNERIRELAEQAGAKDDGDYWGDEYFTLKGEEDIEKFAELIIKECMYLLETEPPAHLFTNEAYDRGYHDSRKDAVIILKTHFGVE